MDIIEGRKLIEAYRSSKSNDTEKITTDLEGLGFSSLQDFFDWNKIANWQELVRCYTWEGNCDLCRGRLRGCCDASFELSWQEQIVSDKKAHDMIPTLAEWKVKIEKATPKNLAEINSRSNPYMVFFSWHGYENKTPPNCAYTLVKLADPAFDFLWEMYVNDKILTKDISSDKYGVADGTPYLGLDHELRRL